MNNINLSELDLENIGAWPMIVKVVVALISSILLGLFGYWLIIKPNLDVYLSLKNQEKALRVEFEQKQQLSVNLQAYQVQLKEMETSFGAMLRQLPAANEMPGLLEDISKTGTSSGLIFQSFLPQKEIMHDFYVELPIKITVTGTYHQFAVFISRIAVMNRIVTMHELVIENAIATNNSAQTSDMLQMTMTAKIYRYRVPS